MVLLIYFSIYNMFELNAFKRCFDGWVGFFYQARCISGHTVKRSNSILALTI
jgi:hypothetical protein